MQGTILTASCRRRETSWQSRGNDASPSWRRSATLQMCRCLLIFSVHGVAAVCMHITAGAEKLDSAKAARKDPIGGACDV